MRKIRRRLTPQENRESAHRAIRAFDTILREDGGLGIGAGNSSMGEVPDHSYHVRRDDVRSIASPYADGGEAEGPGKFGPALRRGGYKKLMQAKSGHGVYENESGHRLWVKGDECYSKSAEGAKKHYEDEVELEAGMPRKRESIRSFFKRYAREL